MDKLQIIDDRPILQVGSSGFLRLEKTGIKLLSIGSQGVRGPAGATGATGGGLERVQDDPNPHLGGNLDMNGFQFLGQAESDDFYIDGGLI